jgi:rRNA maturation RNase YbeY
MILNRQRTVRVARRPLELFLRRLQQHLGLAITDVTICLVSDAEITRMNEAFRKEKGPTDVLSFPAFERRRPFPLPHFGPGSSLGSPPAAPVSRRRLPQRATLNRPTLQGPALAVPKRRHNSSALAPEGKVVRRGSNDLDYLGDIAISPAAARRNARSLGRTLPGELQVLILHGVLHLLGYDHQTDRGQMTRIERNLRRRLGLA